MKLLALALLSATVASPALAATLPTTFSFTVSGSSTGSGFLEAVDQGGYYDITDISGTFNGATITGLVARGSVPVIDNVLHYPGTPYLTSNGMAFRAGGVVQEIWYNFGIGQYRTSTFPVYGITSVDFSIAPALTAVPEPATWATLILGFALVGAGVRRARRTVVRFA